MEKGRVGFAKKGREGLGWGGGERERKNGGGVWTFELGGRMVNSSLGREQ